jgi:hypothetical protein
LNRLPERGKKKPAVEAGLNPILLRRVGGDRKQYAALQHIGPIFV